MSFTDPGYIADVLDGILQTVADALAAAGRPVDRVLRSPGIASSDCGLLAVWPRLRIVNPETFSDAKAIRCAVRYCLDANLLLTRCLASAGTDGIPPAALVDEDGVGYATDMWVIQRTLTLGVQAATLVPGGCIVARINALTPATPSGGLSAITTTIEVNLG